MVGGGLSGLAGLLSSLPRQEAAVRAWPRAADKGNGAPDGPGGVEGLQERAALSLVPEERTHPLVMPGRFKTVQPALMRLFSLGEGGTHLLLLPGRFNWTITHSHLTE